MRTAEVEKHVNDALSHPTEAQRLNGLLMSYVTAPPKLRDSIFAEVAYRLSWYDDAVTIPSNLPQASPVEVSDPDPASMRSRLWELFRRPDARSRRSGS